MEHSASECCAFALTCVHSREHAGAELGTAVSSDCASEDYVRHQLGQFCATSSANENMVLFSVLFSGVAVTCAATVRSAAGFCGPHRMPAAPWTDTFKAPHRKRSEKKHLQAPTGGGLVGGNLLARGPTWQKATTGVTAKHCRASTTDTRGAGRVPRFQTALCRVL